jgi:hypothetical protein
MKYDAEIRFAEDAVLVGVPDHQGGIMCTNGGRIVSCRRGITFEAFPNLSMANALQYCYFDFAGASSSYARHVKVKGIDMIRITDCIFSGAGLARPELGIDLADGSAYINACRFHNLYQGIGITPTKLRRYTPKISYSYFENCHTGIHASGVLRLEISYNRLVITDRDPNLRWNLYEGIALFSCNFFNVHHNTVYSTASPNMYKRALRIDNSGTVGKIVYRNVLKDGWVGFSSYQGDNRGLQLECNTFSNNGGRDWEVDDAPGMLDQGSLLYPAGNTFSHTCNTLTSDFNIISTAPGLTYYHAPITAHEPSCFSASLSKVSVSVTPCTKAYESGNYNDLISWRAANTAEKSSLSPPPNDGGRLNQLNVENDFLLTLIVQSYMDEDLIDDCIAYLEDEDDDLARIFLVGFYIDKGSFDDAQTALDGINADADNEEEAAFIQLYNVILTLAQDELGYADMTDEQWGVIHDIADGSTVYGACARNIIAEYENPDLAPQIASVKRITQGPVCRIFPNPAQETLRIEGAENGSIYTITDLGGRMISQGKITSSSVGIDVRELDGGVYLIKIISKQGLQQTLKFVKAD